MSLILNIDTATEFASICLSKDGVVIGFEENREQKSHASFLQPAIQKSMINGQWSLDELDAIAVTNGPGSYTGLRVGLASAKGLCFVLNKPLILLNTLEVMTNGIMNNEANNSKFKIQNSKLLFCPMIDARRLEVFTALYNQNLECLLQPTAMVLDENSFTEHLSNNKIIFSGSGAEKFSNIIKNENAIFSNVQYSAKDMIQLSEKAFVEKKFADLAYSSPNYGKEFYTPMGKKH